MPTGSSSGRTPVADSPANVGENWRLGGQLSPTLPGRPPPPPANVGENQRLRGQFSPTFAGRTGARSGAAPGPALEVGPQGPDVDAHGGEQHPGGLVVGAQHGERDVLAADLAGV